MQSRLTSALRLRRWTLEFSKARHFSGRATRIRRGAALIVALVAVVVLAVLMLAGGRLTTAFFMNEETAQGATRALALAEAAANWQLNRMSRSDGSDTPAASSQGANRLPYADIANLSHPFPSADPTDFQPPLASELGIGFGGAARVWVQTAPSPNTLPTDWQPPNDFDLRALGRDPETGVVRGVHFLGRAAGLSARYAVFGLSRVNLGDPQSPGVPTTLTLQTGLVGTNDTLQSASQTTVQRSAVFGGFLLAGTQAGALWSLADTPPFPRLPAPVVWPSVADVVRRVWRGSAPADIAAHNANAEQIARYDYTTRRFVPFPTAPTQLTDAEFRQAADPNDAGRPRCIRLTAMPPTAANPYELFRFTDIQMGANDVLVLDLRKPAVPTDSPTGLRILIDGPNAANPLTLTNLAYYNGSNRAAYPASVLWLNNTGRTLRYQPFPSALPDGFTLAPYAVPRARPLFGLVYSPGSPILIAGVSDAAHPITVDALVGSEVTLRGVVTVRGNRLLRNGVFQEIEDPTDPHRYPLYYRVLRDYGETDVQGNPIRHDASGYGRFQP